MTTTIRLALTLSLLLVPALASAQTFVVEVDPQPLVMVPSQAPPEAPLVMQPPSAPPVARPPAPLAVDPAPETDIDAAVGLGLWVEMMSLDAMTLTFRDPEISALDGVALDHDWQGFRALRQPVLTGGTISVGMRADDWIRGPELRLSFGGVDMQGDDVPAPGGSGISLRLEQALVLRAELALGVQAPLGAFRPYVQARVGVGGAFVDVHATDARLGALGTETLDEVIADVGVEAGVAFYVGDDIELGAAFRAGVNHHGDESIGGTLTLTVVEED